MSGLETIDAGRALDLLCEAARRQGEQPIGSRQCGIVAAALSETELDEPELARLRRCDVRTMWVDGRLPLPMTLGAVVVFHRAQRAERAGLTWRVAVSHAARSAQLYLGLVPVQACAGSAPSSTAASTTTA